MRKSDDGNTGLITVSVVFVGSASQFRSCPVWRWIPDLAVSGFEITGMFIGNGIVLQERRKRLHLGLESCGGYREVPVEA
jgi:hypothetical protein